MAVGSSVEEPESDCESDRDDEELCVSVPESEEDIESDGDSDAVMLAPSNRQQ